LSCLVSLFLILSSTPHLGTVTRPHTYCTCMCVLSHWPLCCHEGRASRVCDFCSAAASLLLFPLSLARYCTVRRGLLHRKQLGISVFHSFSYRRLTHLEITFSCQVRPLLYHRMQAVSPFAPPQNLTTVVLCCASTRTPRLQLHRFLQQRSNVSPQDPHTHHTKICASSTCGASHFSDNTITSDCQVLTN
jgi:hypothetical protein